MITPTRPVFVIWNAERCGLWLFRAAAELQPPRREPEGRHGASSYHTPGRA
jgi:hypothetical protein